MRAEVADMDLKFTFFFSVISRSFFTEHAMVDPWIKRRKSKDGAKKPSKKPPYRSACRRWEADFSLCVYRTTTLPICFPSVFFEGTFLVAFGGDGCPFGKNESGCSFLISFFNVGKRVAWSSDNFLVFGANIEESSVIVKRYVQSVCKQIADLEGNVFEINGLHVNF